MSGTLLELVPALSSTAVILPASQGSPQVDVSYETLRGLVLQLRDGVRQLGVGRGDVVAMSLINGLAYVVGFLGTGAARAVSAPLNPSYSPSEVEFYLGDTKPVLILLPHLSALPASHPDRKGGLSALEAARKTGVQAAEFWIDESGKVQLKVVFQGNAGKGNKKAREGGDPSPDDVALVLHTSGTTGRPKSVPLTHHNLLTTTKNIVQTYWLTTHDRSYLVMPLFHVHGLLAGLLAPLRSRGSIVIPDRFSPSRFWNDFATTSCTWYTAVPTMHSILLSSPKPDPMPRIRFIRSCSSSLSPITFQRLEEAFGAPVLEAYAMTEASHQMTSNSFHSRIPGTVGVGQGVEVSIRDMETGKELPRGQRGEVCVRGQNVTKGYWENDKANRESFWEGRWFRTGDQGLIQTNFPHHLELTGRIKELINRGGEKISPLEVDSALLAVEGVAVKEAVCFGVEDEKYGEVVWAAVVLGDSNASGAESKIQKALQGKISKFKIPERIIVVPSIPKGATGKISRKNVREVLLKEHKKTSVKAKL